MDHPSALSYESRIPGAILPDEAILWERQPIAPEPIPLIKGTLAVVGVVAFMGGFAAIFTRDVFAIAVCSLVAAIVMSLLALSLLHEAMARRRKLARSTFRITNRRIMRVQEQGGGKCDELPMVELARFDFEHRERGELTRFYSHMNPVAGVEFGTVENRGLLESHIISQHRATQRRATLRRVRHLPTTMNSDSNVQPPPWLTLSADEVLLWTGRPKPWRWRRRFVMKRAIVMVTLAIPAIGLLVAMGFFPSVGDLPWLVTLVAATWLLGGINGIFIRPIRDARRLARTSYAVTNVRAVAHEAGFHRRTRSFLLDMVDRAELISTDDDDGGTISIAFAVQLENVADASRVYTIVLDAIRDSGGLSSAAAQPIVSDAAGR